jgi:hypothetical protein
MPQGDLPVRWVDCWLRAVIDDTFGVIASLTYDTGGMVIVSLSELQTVHIERFQPRLGQFYFSSRVGMPVRDAWNDDREDIARYVAGDCFETEEEAKRATQYLYGGNII